MKFHVPLASPSRRVRSSTSAFPTPSFPTAFSPTILVAAFVVSTVLVSARLEAQPTLVLDLGPSPARVGSSADPIPVRLRVSNPGAAAIADVRVEMAIPDTLRSFANASVRGGACDWVVGSAGSCDAGETLSFPVGTLAPGEGRTLGFSALLAELPEDSTVVLNATAFSAGGETRAAAEIRVAHAPFFEVELRADREPAGAGEPLTYSVHWGHVALERVAPFARLRLHLPRGVRFVAASPGGVHSASEVGEEGAGGEEGNVAEGDSVDWDLGTLSPGAAGEVRAHVIAGETLRAGEILRASAELSDATASGLLPSAARVRASATTRVETGLDVDLAMDLSLDPLRSGDSTFPETGRPIDVRLTVTNRAPFALRDLRVEVPIPARLLGFAAASVLGGGCDWIAGSAGACQAPERVSFPIDLLEPGSGRTLGFSAFVRELPDGSTLALEAFLDAGTRHLVAERALSIRARPEFELAVFADREPAGAGEVVRYSIPFGHVADDAIARDVRLRLELPPDVEPLAASDGGESADGAVEWSLGDLNPGAGGERYATVLVDAALPDGSILAARASLLEGDSPLSELARASTSTRVRTGSPLVLSLELGGDPLGAGPVAGGGRALEVRATVSNPGPVALGGVRVELPLSSRLASIARAGILGGGCDWINGSAGACDHAERAIFEVGELPPGGGRTVAFFAAARELPAAALLGLEAFASAGVHAARDIAIVRLLPAPRFELTLAAEQDPVPADTETTYTLSWGYLDATQLASDARLELRLPDAVQFVSASRDGQPGSDASGTYVEWSLGTLEPGLTGRRTITVRTDEGLPAGTQLEAIATIAEESTPERAARAVSVTRIGDSPLELELEVDSSVARPGDELLVSLRARNRGQVALDDLVIEVPIPDLLDAFANVGISEGACDWIVGSAGRCEHTERVRFDIPSLAPGAEVERSFRPAIRTANGGPPLGSIVRFRAYLSRGGLQLAAVSDVRVGEDEPSAPSGRFVRSDANADARVDIADSVFSLNYLFLGGADLACLDAADADDDGALRITDAIFGLNFLFLGGDPPPAPWGSIPGACGEDPTLDALDCASHAPCEL